MHTVPVRGADGKIVELMDPRALEEQQEEIQSAQPQQPDQEEEAPTRRSRALRPEERKPLRELLGSSPSVPHANRSFTTGMVAGLLGALIVAALIVLSRTPASDRPPLATSVPATVSVSTSDVSAATAPVVVIAPTLPPTVGRALVAYAAPEGAVVGAISADRAISLTGTFGSEWVQIETVDSGQVWVKQVDLPTTILQSSTLADLPDLAPPPTATALPAPTSAPVARPLAPAAPASAPAPMQHCTPDRVVAIVERGVTQIASCVSLADALRSLPGSTVVAQDADAAQTYYEQADVQATALAQPSR